MSRLLFGLDYLRSLPWMIDHCPLWFLKERNELIAHTSKVLYDLIQLGIPFSFKFLVRLRKLAYGL